MTKRKPMRAIPALAAVLALVLGAPGALAAKHKHHHHHHNHPSAGSAMGPY